MSMNHGFEISLLGSATMYIHISNFKPRLIMSLNVYLFMLQPDGTAFAEMHNRNIAE